jgi:hypothetical protein
MQAILHKITPLNQYSSNYVSLVYHRIYQKYRLAKACPEQEETRLLHKKCAKDVHQNPELFSTKS